MADDDAPVPSLTSGEIGSRFVSQTELDAANKTRDEAWKAAYARIGQEPPPREEPVYDGRSLAEKLAANKAAKQEEWEQKNKLSNQFRALEPDEVLFLDTVSAAEHKKEQERKAADDEAIDGFKAALTHDECISFVAAKAASSSQPPIPSLVKPTAPPPVPTPSATTRPVRPVSAKAKLKGVVVTSRKRAKPEGEEPSEPASTATPTAKKDSNVATKTEEKGQQPAKRRRLV